MTRNPEDHRVFVVHATSSDDCARQVFPDGGGLAVFTGPSDEFADRLKESRKILLSNEISQF